MIVSLIDVFSILLNIVYILILLLLIIIYYYLIYNVIDNFMMFLEIII